MTGKYCPDCDRELESVLFEVTQVRKLYCEGCRHFVLWGDANDAEATVEVDFVFKVEGQITVDVERDGISSVNDIATEKVHDMDVYELWKQTFDTDCPAEDISVDVIDTTEQ